MDRDFVGERYGTTLTLGPCIVGRNIDNLCLEGFARIDELAVISEPDIFDDEVNPTGTQRELKQAHASASFKFASEPPKTGEENTRAFPEIILNVRDMIVIDVRSWVDDTPVDFDSRSSQDHVKAAVVKVVVDLDSIEFPHTTVSPEISRVDGNHRLDGWDKYLDALSDGLDLPPVEFPTIPFMLFLNLTLEEEVKVFNDFNGKHEGMEPSLLLTQIVRLGSKEELVKDPERLPSWITYELTRQPRAFSGITFVGGSRRGAQEAGLKLRVTSSAVRSAVRVMLKNSHRLRETLVDQPDAILNIIDNFWKAIKETFPEAWENKRDYILLQSIGLNGFAEFGASLIDTTGSTDTEEFRQILESLKNSIVLERASPLYAGVAGAGGAKRVALLLAEASTEESIWKQKALQKVGGAPTSDEQKIEKLAQNASGATEQAT